MIEFPSRYETIALQFSGGKDSLALAWLLRPYWDHLTFYHVDTGDLLPEIRNIVCEVEKVAPRFVRIETNSAEWMETVGYPSDLVPTSCTPAGLAIGMGNSRIVDRFDCCASNIMAPMHERMRKDLVTLVIRGTKRCDFKNLPCEDGDTRMGYDLWQPLLEWSHADVMAYLREQKLPIAKVYDQAVNAPECATCPAWWSEKRSAYLRINHPMLFASYKKKLTRVTAEVAPLWMQLQGELNG